jgi:hypothetical protein
MNSNMAFLGSHSINFSGAKQTIIVTIGKQLSKHQFENLQFFKDYEQSAFKDCEHLKTVHKNDRWQFTDFSIDGMYGIKDKRKVIVAIGPYGLMLRISNTYVEFLSPLYNRPNWYSPKNAKTVTEWRKYFKQITTLFGGQGTLYITQAYFDKYHNFFRDTSTTYPQKIETLIQTHGPIKKPFADCSKGKYPRYFFDTFTNP